MALVPYSVTALAESDAEGTSGKNIIAGAIVEFYNAETGGSAQTLYDDAASANPSTTKATDAQGQVTVFVEQGLWWMTINGGTRRAVTIDNSASVISAIAGESIAPATVTTTGNLGVRGTPPSVVSLGAYGQGTTSSTYSIAAYNGSSELAFGVRDNKLAEFYGDTEIFGDAKLDNAGSTASANVLNFQTSGVVDGYISHAANTAILEISSGRSVAWGGDIKFITDTVTALSIDNSQTVSPGTDNTQDFGSASFRWSEFFAGNGTINTSDETQKTEITALTDTEKGAYLAVKNIIGSYKWLDAIDEKGESARVHVGVGAQSAIAEFTSRGLDWQKYACFCLDDIYTIDENGEKVPAGQRYGIRYNELIMGILASI